MTIKIVELECDEGEEISKFPFFDLSDDLLCVINSNGNFQHINGSGEKILGFPPNELQQKSFLDGVHPEDRFSTREQLAQLSADRGPIAFENRYQCKNGDYKRLSWKAQWRGSEPLIWAIARELSPVPEGSRESRHSSEDDQAFFDLSLDLFCTLSFDGYFRSLNPAWEKTLGFTPAELRAQSFIEFVHPQDHQSTLTEFVKLLQGCHTYSFENRYRCKNGDYRWLLWSACLGRDRQCIYAIAHDITERKYAELEGERAYEETRTFLNQLQVKLQSRSLAFNSAIYKLQNEIAERRETEKSLEKEREFLKALLNTVDAGIIAGDATGNLILFNRSIRDLYGLPDDSIPPEEWLNYYDLYQGDGMTPIAPEQIPLTRALNGERVNKEELVIAPKMGEPRIVVASGEPIFDEQGHKIGAVIAFHDITESKQKALALQESAHEKTELIQSLQNQAQQLQNTLQELQRTQTQLIQSEKMSSLGQLVAGVAHEINNPVNFIYGNLAHVNDYLADLLKLLNLYQIHYPKPVEEIHEFQEDIDLDFLQSDLPKLLTSMKVGAERIRQIVLSLRNFSRLNEAECKPVDIHEGIDNTLLILHNRLREKSGHSAISVVKEYGKLPRIECYPAQLNQAIINIMTNAIDALESLKGEECFGDKTPTLRIRTECLDNQWVTIHIQDNGPGMTAGVKEQIFNPFFTTKPVGKGTGLGLSIAYQIITHKHSGELICHSEPGEGTEFVIQIPLKQPLI
ncbi:PAS domain S-box protein [Laspinema sp. A4]|uniref:PAS domain-containing sensor histidine kinase n=1 Tax=Laspinema sp. D2d TaxID=2953686 RepID=UPI0021BA6D76|nr:PAS domain S-box protein [Laspinema sp. D2d]MCT7984664.1 PAS domain S-box protein [Laspinema sp. D2d]